jgi:hypothetical protein
LGKSGFKQWLVRRRSNLHLPIQQVHFHLGPRIDLTKGLRHSLGTVSARHVLKSELDHCVISFKPIADLGKNRMRLTIVGRSSILGPLVAVICYL